LIAVERKAALTGHRDCVYALTKSGQPRQLFSAGGDGQVVQWDLDQPDQGRLLAKVGNSVYALCYLPGQNRLVAGQNTEGVHLIDLAGQQAIRSAKITSSAIFAIQHFEQKLYVGTGEGVLTVLDAEQLTTLAHLRLAGQSLRSMAIHPQRRELACGFSDAHVRVLDLDSGLVKYDWAAHANSVFSLAYSPDGSLLFSGSRDAHLKVWDVGAGYLAVDDIVAHMYTINDVAFSPDGALFATCSKDKSVKLWDTAGRRLLKVIDRARHAGHGTSVNKLLWTGERELVAASDDRSLSVWAW
jgi:WD40 repeat protein